MKLEKKNLIFLKKLMCAILVYIINKINTTRTIEADLLPAINNEAKRNKLINITTKKYFLYFKKSPHKRPKPNKTH